MAKESGRRPNGDGALFQRGDGTWVARLDLGYDELGRRRRWTGKSKDRNVALNKLRKARKEYEDTGTVSNKSTTVAQWLDHWIEQIARPSVKPMTYVDYERCIRLHLKPGLGRYKLHQMTPADVRTFEQKLAKAKTPATARSAHRVLSAALSDAASDGLVMRNVAQLVTPPKVVAKTRSALTVEEAKQVIEATADQPLGSRWAFALYTGTRQGESIGLEWDRVDLKEGTADISWQLQRLPFEHGCGGTCDKKRAGSCPDRRLALPEGFEHRVVEGGLVLTRPKTHRGRRVIPLPPTMVDALRTLRKQSLTKGLVWTREGGRPIDPAGDLEAWHDMLEEVGVRSVPLHSARHTTATLLMELGVDVTVIQSIMGHTEVTTTQGYQHADLSMARRAIDGLGEALSK
jgi:integrase